ncbi:MAG: mercuric transporter MerT family protein, partial [bacterium]
MKKEKLAAAGSVFAAVAASLCCIGPLIALLLGAGSLAAASTFAKLRPIFLGVTFVLLAVAWYFTYRKPKAEACAEGTACATKPGAKWNKVMLWIATVFAIALATFPLYAGVVARLLHPDKPHAILSDASGLA